MEIKELEKFAKEIRYYTLKELNYMGYGHYGGSLSIVEVLAVIYGEHLNASPETKDDPNRDYFVLSKGHGGPALYATLSLKGYFPEEWLYTLNQNGTNLPSHPDRNKTPGIDMTTGSLGQGISAATGIALGNKIAARNNFTYAIVGDGELNEGQCWEAIQMAAHNQLDNLIVFVDDNKKQLDGYTIDISNPFDFAEKFIAFGFNTVRVDGHSVNAISKAITSVKVFKGKPSVIILDTIKGKGIKHIEEMMDNHHLRPDDETNKAIQATIQQIGEELGVLV
ncbi:transketolase [Carnobacterium iners]|uniref:Transketolase n=1 Tax=Carnobacterium iners TaxID=1073423 RepID=A0A1X7NBR4_9LACT|nr:transketolase [Carnobacterium iners]SEK51263.1 transketolase [Carnobacterium iners]SMH34561.1 transketolase [Carnobacterium iners]